MQRRQLPDRHHTYRDSNGVVKPLGDGHWEMTTRHGVTYDFDTCGRPIDVRDLSGNRIAYEYYGGW